MWPGLAALFVSATLIGTLYIFYTVSAQHLIGAFGAGHKRTRNYATFSLGVALTALLGPTMTGFLIDSIGHQSTYLVLALLPVGPVVFLLFFARGLPRVAEDAKRSGQRTMDLVRNLPLRRAFIAAGIIETGGELYNFYMPIYGHSIGLSASLIGIIIGTYAIAVLMTRAGDDRAGQAQQRGDGVVRFAGAGGCGVRAVSVRHQCVHARGGFLCPGRWGSAVAVRCRW